MNPLRVLVVCTANACRSPVVEQLLQRRLDAFGISAIVTSSGTDGGATPVHHDTMTAAREFGVDLRLHRPRRLTTEQISYDGSDLVVTMTRDHLYRVVELSPASFGHAFTLIELARLAGEVGPNPFTTDVAGWLTALSAERSPGVVANDRRPYDVDDPYGRPRRFHAQMIKQVDALVNSTVSILAPSIDLSVS